MTPVIFPSRTGHDPLAGPHDPFAWAVFGALLAIASLALGIFGPGLWAALTSQLSHFA